MQIRSITEDYIKDLLANGKRDDGRKMLEARPIEIITGHMPNAEGSAQTSIGNTKVLVGVKVDIDEPMPDKPKEGNIITSAELLPLASVDYETGPPSPEAIELARVVDRGIRASKIIDTESLFVEEGKVWSVFIDVYVLDYHGNLFDASTISAVTALMSARMPKFEDGKVIREGKMQKFKTNGMLTSCTFAKIGKHIIFDPDSNEEAFMDSRVTIATDEKKVYAMQKGLSGTFTAKEIDELVGMSLQRSKDISAIIKNALGN